MACAKLKDETAERVLDLVYAHSNSSGEVDVESHRQNLTKLRRFIDRGDEIHFVLPAFPAKSPNREKTLSAMPDMADFEGLRMLNELALRIAGVYAPGARILICSDGRVFADVVRVSDLEVENYKRAIERMIAVHGLERLATFHLEDVFGHLSFERMREKLSAEFSLPLDQLRAKMPGDQSLKLMFNGIHRFMFEDQLVLSPQLSREKARQAAKQLAYQVIQRSNAWSALIEARFKDSLRLSIHPQIPQSPKLGVRLVAGKSGWCTPWHNVLVSDGNRKVLMKKSEAEGLGARLSASPEGYLFFKAAPGVL